MRESSTTADEKVIEKPNSLFIYVPEKDAVAYCDTIISTVTTIIFKSVLFFNKRKRLPFCDWQTQAFSDGFEKISVNVCKTVRVPRIIAPTKKAARILF